MKKVFIALLLMSLLAMPACSAKEEPAPESSQTDADPVELELWIYDEFYSDGEFSPIQRVVDEFMDENPNVQVNIIPTPYGSSSYRDKFIQAATGGAGPDIILSDNIWVPQLASMELIKPIDDMFADRRDEYFDGTIDAGSYKGQIYGVPFHVDVMVLFYNKTRFAEAGLDPNAPPTTWDEFRNDAIALTDEENGKYGFGGLFGWTGSFEWLPWLWQNGGSVLNEDQTKAVFNSQEGIEATEFFLNLILKDKVVPDAAMSWKSWDELTAGFASGTIGMCEGMNVMLSKLDKLDETFEWGVAVLPKQKEAAATLGGGHFVISNECENPELAYKLIEKITSADNLDMMDAYSRLSARKDSGNQKMAQEDERIAVFVQALEDARPRPTIPEWSTIDYDTIQPAFAKILWEGGDIEEEMNKAAEIVNSEVLSD
ncbi:sugar ABC transporter substrate-binding protein [Clostridia bacterium]|nr:sugar ABC transporter substrate-binding protein [Clostridia bacterium]